MSKKPAIKHYTIIYIGIAVFAIIVMGLIFYNSSTGNNYLPSESHYKDISNPTYSQQIKSILYKRCTFCHKAGGIMAKKPLDSYYGIMNVMKPGNLESPLITKTQQGGSMTQYLSKEEAELLKVWVQKGAN